MSAKSISNVFKIFGAVSLVGLLSVASLQADETNEAQATQTGQNTQEQAQKVDSSAESKPISTNTNASKANKSGAFGFCKGQHASTGCFIGASVGLAFGENYMPSIRPDASSDYIPSQEKSFTAFPVNIDLGWQWYYAQNAGFRFKGYVGYGYYGTKFDEVIFNSDALKFDATIHAIQYGLEASYLYDFVYKGNHNFGAHISVGFEGTSFVGQKVKISSASYDITFPSYSKFTWTSGIGIHYFYKVHHQFFLSYLYKGYKNDKTIGNNEVRVYGTGEQANMSEVRMDANFFKISTTPNSTIMLSYVYKF